MPVTQVTSEVMSSSTESAPLLPPFCVAIVLLSIFVIVFILGIYTDRWLTVHFEEFHIALPVDEKPLAVISPFFGDIDTVWKVESKSEMEAVEGKDEDLLDRMLNSIPARASPIEEEEVRQALLRILA